MDPVLMIIHIQTRPWENSIEHFCTSAVLKAFRSPEAAFGMINWMTFKMIRIETPPKNWLRMSEMDI